MRSDEGAVVGLPGRLEAASTTLYPPDVMHPSCISPFRAFGWPSLPAAALSMLLLVAANVPAARAADIPAGELSTAEIATIVRQQAAELAAQRALIEKQQDMLESQRALIEKQQQELSAQRDALNTLQAGGTPTAAEAATATPAAPVAGTASPVPPVAANNKGEAGQNTARQSADDPLLGYDPASFPGGFPLPGTSAALRIGGFVKANVVQSTDSVGTQDRFIVGSIPTDPAFDGDAEAAMTASQSRLNFELRENSSVGQFRAFIEGDFAGQGETFRMRHAFGQYGAVLAGKTWSTFMDTEASPEEVDFEGINGRINQRHTQFRYFPNIGREWNLAVALEDPGVVVFGGDGLSQIPDVVLSAKRSVAGLMFGDRQWHLKAAGLYRSIRARPTANPGDKDSAVGWGLSISGQTGLDVWDLEFWDPRDTLMFQLNYGQGYSTYVNDLSSIGMPDAAFNPVDGRLDTIDAIAWYLAVRHWWGDTLRSNLIVSQVDVNDLSFAVSDDYGENYDGTWRVSGNLIWSPVPRVDVGGEMLWGKRRNSDGSSGQSTQLQLSVKYLF